MSKEKRLYELDLAFEDGVETSPNLWRVSYWRKALGKRLRCTNAKWRDIFKAVPNHYTHFRSMQGAMRVVEEKRAARERRLAAKVAP